MPNRVKEPHAKDPRKLATGRWQARVTYYDPDTGKRRETSQTFATEREAKKWSREQEMAYRENPNRKPPSEEPLAEYLTRWLETMQPPRTRPSTWRGYQQKLQYVIKGLGDEPLRAITTQDIQQLYGRLGKELGAQSIVHVHRVFRQALQAAEDWDLILKNPARKVTLPKVPRPDLRIPTAEEAQRFMRAADSHRLRALWLWLALNGTRMGEALGARWDDVDWDRRAVRIQQNLTGEGKQRALGPVKSRDGFRVIELSDFMVAALKTHQTNQQQEQQLVGEQWQESGLIFVTRKGTWLDPRNVHRDFKKMLKKAALPLKIRPHDMRHFMATHWLTSGVPLKVVSARLGHSDEAFTIRIYGHVLTGQQRTAVDAVDARLTGPAIPISSPRTLKPEYTGAYPSDSSDQ